MRLILVRHGEAHAGVIMASMRLLLGIADPDRPDRVGADP